MNGAEILMEKQVSKFQRRSCGVILSGAAFQAERRISYYRALGRRFLAPLEKARGFGKTPTFTHD
jgi:hypothetical protein